MKLFGMIFIGLLLGSSTFAATLPAECESMAWEVTKATGNEGTGYQNISYITQNGSDYSAQVTPNETASFFMEFHYDQGFKKCYLMSVKVDYR